MAIKPVLRGKYYHAVGTYRGVFVRESLKTRSRPAAEDLCARIMQRILDEGLHGKKRTKTFAEGVITYWEKGGRYSAKVLGEYNEKLNRWSRLLGAFGDRQMSDITEDDLHEYCRLNHKRAKAATWNRSVIVPVKAVMRANRIDAYLRIDRLREERVETPHASPEYFVQAIKAYSSLPHLCALVMTMTLTGRRLGEVIAWRRDDMDWVLGEIYTGRTKNGDAITVKIPEKILPLLQALPRYENGRMFRYQTKWSPQEVMKQKCEKAGIPYLSPHKIGRHTFATWALKYGNMDIKQVKEAGGWRSLSALERYLHVRPSDAQIASGKLIDQVPGLHKINTVMDDDAKT